MVFMHNQAWSVSRIVLTGMDVKVLHLELFAVGLSFVCVRACVWVSDLKHGFGGEK